MLNPIRPETGQKSGKIPQQSLGYCQSKTRLQSSANLQLVRTLWVAGSPGQRKVGRSKVLNPNFNFEPIFYTPTGSLQFTYTQNEQESNERIASRFPATPLWTTLPGLLLLVAHRRCRNCAATVPEPPRASSASPLEFTVRSDVASPATLGAHRGVGDAAGLGALPGSQDPVEGMPSVKAVVHLLPRSRSPLPPRTTNRLSSSRRVPFRRANSRSCILRRSFWSSGVSMPCFRMFLI